MKKWLHLVSISALLAVNMGAYGKETINLPDANKDKKQEWAKQSAEHHAQVIDRTQAVVSLLGAEMALNQGDALTAITTYMANFQKTYQPEVAQRLVNLLMSARAYTLVDKLNQLWLENGDTTSPVTQYLAFNNALVQRNAKEVNALMDEVFAQIDDNQRNQLFYILAINDLAMSDEATAFERDIADKVYKVTKKYQHLASANLVSMYFGSRYDNNRQALNALTQLQQNEPELDDAMQYVLRFLMERNPSLWETFFAKNQNKLSTSWQELRLDYLVTHEKYEEANLLIQHILDNQDTPSAMLYFQAALLADQQKEPSNISLAYLDKAYQLAHGELQSRIALFSAVHHVQNLNFIQAKTWVNKISDSKHRFEQQMLLAVIERGQKHWQKALQHLQNAKKIDERTHFIFEDGDIEKYELSLQGELQSPAQAIKDLTKKITELQKQAPTETQQEQLKQLFQQRGFIYTEKLNQHADAVRDLRQALAIDPNNPYSQNALGYTLLSGSQDEINEGFELIEQAFQQRPTPAIMDSLGWAYYKKGNLEEALTHLKRAYSLQPDPELAAHLGEVYWQMGDEQQAKKIWQEGWQKDQEHPILNETLQRFKLSF